MPHRMFPRLGATIADEPRQMMSTFAKAINRAGIPCVLWDDMMIDAFGVGLRVGIRHMGFAVPDHQVNGAAHALLKDRGNDLTKGFTVCSEADCCYTNAEFELLPDTHLHINPGGFDYTPPPLFIFSQSRVLWALPPLDERYLPPPFAADEEVFHRTISSHYVLTTDTTVCPPRKYMAVGPDEFEVRTWDSGLGVWDESMYPALAPKPYLAGEAYVRLVICHLWTHKEIRITKRMRSLGMEQENEQFYSFDEMHPLMREMIQAHRSSRKPRQVYLALAHHFGYEHIVEMLEHADWLDKHFR